MKFTPGPFIAAASGSVGGMVASRNRYGAYWRNRSIPTKSMTDAANAAKARLAQMSAFWQLITAPQRLAWNTYAQTHPVTDALGFPQVLTGHAMYVGLNSRLSGIGESPLTMPPVEAAPSSLSTLTATWDIGAGDFTIVFTTSPIAADDVLAVRAAVVQSAGIVYVENLLRLVGYSAKNQATGYDTQSLIEARLGALQVDDYVHLDISVCDSTTGLVSGHNKVSGVVVST